MIWPVLYFWKAANSMVRNGKAVSLGVAFLLWINNVIDVVVFGGLYAINGLLKLLNVSAFENVSLGNLPMIEYINGVFPVSELVSLAVIFTTACVSLLVIRWVKSFIPTIAN